MSALNQTENKFIYKSDVILPAEFYLFSRILSNYIHPRNPRMQ